MDFVTGVISCEIKLKLNAYNKSSLVAQNMSNIKDSTLKPYYNVH